MQPHFVQPGVAGARFRARATRPRLGPLVLRVLAVAAIWLAAFVALIYDPRPLLDRSQGLYAADSSTAGFRWTTSQALIPLVQHSGPTHVSMVLSTVLWRGRANRPIQLATDAGPLGSFVVAPQPRRYQLLLPPMTSALRLTAPIARPPGGEWRWLGIQIFQAGAVPSGLPLRTAALALLLTLAFLPAQALARWLVHRGYGALLALGLAGLALRLLWLTSAPPGLHRDEAVSLVDAWNLLRTGHDHLGHALPIAAFEAYGDWTSPLLTYLQVPLVGLLGPQPLAARLAPALVGALVVPIVFGLARALRLPQPAAIGAALVAALSPWQIYLSRVAIPPALVPACWGLCLLAAVRFVREGRSRDAFALALAAGIALYAYPTMKLAVPLLLALAVALALAQHGRRAAAAWWRPALLLALLWLPFAASTLLNPLSGARFQQIGLTADSPAAWLAKWWHEYAVYLQPDFYYHTGDTRKAIRGVAGHGAELAAEALLLAPGLAALALLVCTRASAAEPTAVQATSSGTPGLPARIVARLRGSVRDPRWRLSPLPPTVWGLILGALLIAPLPASLTEHNPNSFRAAAIPPLYALLAGMGVAALWRLAALLPARGPRIARLAGSGALLIALAWQNGGWYADLVLRHPAVVAGPFFFADGQLEMMQRVVEIAPQYDEVWLDTATIGRPYIYLLAAQPMPPAEAQAQIVVERPPLPPNEVTQIGPYHFADLRKLPANLPARELILDRFARSGFVAQQLRRDGRRILVVRGISDLPVVDDASQDDPAEQ